MSGKHTVKIDVGAGGTEKRPLIHPRTDTLTHSLSLSLSLHFPSPCCIDVRAKGSWRVVGIGKNVGDAGTCFDLPEKGLSSRRGKRIHGAKDGERRNERSGASMIRGEDREGRS